MVYASVPAYLDPPNWNQQQHQHHQQPHQAGGSTSTGVGGGGSEANSLLQPVQARPDGGLPAAVRPISMADRARQAKVPQPEAALKCPRCDSSNTKFCYFNNYSLSQPRHFCKTCRRYWTRGGALRNVPVGGGCRRNKRSKSSSNSKSSSSTTPTLGGGGAIGTSNLAPPPNLPFMGSLSDYGAQNIGLNYGGMQSIDPLEYQVGNSSASMGLEQWRLQQIPFFAGLEHQAHPPSLGLYPFEAVEGAGADGFSGQAQGKPTAAGLISQLASVKMEENQQRFNLSRQYMGVGGNDHHYNWGTTGGASGGGGGGGGGNTTNGGGGWTGLSGFNTSSTGNLL